MDLLATWIGPPIQDSFADLLSHRGPEVAAEAVKIFRERFTEIGIYENEVYGGIPEALDGLKSSSSTLLIATSKPEPFAIRVLDHFGLSEFFSGVYGSRFDGGLSNKGDLIEHLLLQESLSASDAVMVGDRKHDVLGAVRNGIPCVGVLYGYGTREELLEAGAIGLCERPLDLLKILG